MAFVDNNPLFSMNGKISRYVIRKFNGRRVISCRPLHYRKFNSKKALSLQSTFSTASRFAKQINSNYELSEAWKQSTLKGFSAYHKIMKANLKFAANGFLTESNIIVPASYLSLIQNVQLAKNTATIIIDNISAIGSKSLPDELALHLIFATYNFQNKSKSSTIFI